MIKAIKLQMICNRDVMRKQSTNEMCAKIVDVND